MDIDKIPNEFNVKNLDEIVQICKSLVPIYFTIKRELKKLNNPSI